MIRFFHRTPRQKHTDMDPPRKIVDFYRLSLQRRKAQVPLKSQSMAQKLPYLKRYFNAQIGLNTVKGCT